MVKSEVGCRLENTLYLTVSDAEMTGFNEEVKNLQLKNSTWNPVERGDGRHCTKDLGGLYDTSILRAST